MKTITFFFHLYWRQKVIEKQIILKISNTNKYRELDNSQRRVSGTLCKKKEEKRAYA